MFTIGNSWIDTRATSTDRSLVGRIYNVYAFDRALSDNEVVAMTQYSLNRFQDAG
jgi:hypothetical protein